MPQSLNHSLLSHMMARLATVAGIPVVQEEAGCDDAITYGLSRYNSQRDVAHFALDLPVVSYVSDECECLLSSAHITIADLCGRLRQIL